MKSKWSNVSAEDVRLFKDTFFVDLSHYFDGFWGFDGIKFDDEIIMSGDQSVQDVVSSVYGVEALALLCRLLEKPYTIDLLLQLYDLDKLPSDVQLSVVEIIEDDYEGFRVVRDDHRLISQHTENTQTEMLTLKLYEISNRKVAAAVSENKKHLVIGEFRAKHN